ncbi:MAG: nucleoside triphosphate pyrophosphatase [Lentisphaeria bacterium]
MMKLSPVLVLASASPRRRELLAAAGVAFEVCPADVDETLLPGEAPTAGALRLARLKAAAVSPRFPDRIVLGADTLVVVDGEALGKPHDQAEARRMLGRLAGRAHEVLTGVCLRRASPPAETAWCARTVVRFRPLDEAAISAYLQRVHVLDKAGAYAIQEHGDRIVAGFDGCFSTVVGLPVEEVTERLAALFGQAG